MRATSKFLLLGAFAMCLSACLPEPPMGSDAAIFKRPSRYGWGGPGQRPGNEPTAPPKPQQQTRNTNRFGHSDNSGNDSGSSRSQDSGSSSNSQGGGDSRTADSRPDSNSRPGDSNSSNSGGGSSSSSSSSGGGGNTDNKMTNSGGGSTSGGNSSGGSANTPPSNLNSYPYARLVPGKKGYVTLPGANASVGEVDVTGIKPGTAVEIDDPRDPSKKIYFRVP